jgi:cell division protein FtsL
MKFYIFNRKEEKDKKVEKTIKVKKEDKEKKETLAEAEKKIRREKAVIIILTTLIVLLLAALAYSMYTFYKTRAEATEQISSLNTTIGNLSLEKAYYFWIKAI